MAKIYLHIGMNKTGSSAIQSYMHKNRPVLKNIGVLWPETGLGRDGQGEGYHYGLSSALGFAGGRAEPADASERQALRDALDEEIAAAGARSVVLSSEFFVLRRDHEPLASFFEGLDVHVVVYLRRHDTWWPSLFAQAIKTSANPPWQRNFRSYQQLQAKNRGQYFVFGELLDAMADLFGQENVSACPYEDGQIEPDLVTHFLKEIGEPQAADLIPPQKDRVNTSLSPRSLSLIDLVQRARIEPVTKGRIIRTIMDEDDGAAGGDLVPAAVRRELAEEHAADYERIAREYLGREDGVLFRDPLPEAQGKDEVGALPFPGAVEFFARHFKRADDPAASGSSASG